MMAIPPTDNRQAWAQRALALIRGCRLALTQVKEEQPFLQEFCRLLVEVGGYPLAWVGLSQDPQSPRIKRVAQAGLAQGFLDLLPAAWPEEGADDDPTAIALRTGQPALCADIPSEPACAPYAAVADALGLSSCLALPVGHQEQVYGVLTLYASEPGAFSPEKRDFLQTLTAFVGQGLANLRLKKDLAVAAADLAGKNRLLDSFPLPFLVLDLEGSILDLNQAALESHGFAREKLLGLNWRNLVVPEYQELTGAHLQKIVSLGEAVWESAHQRQDRTSFPVALHSRLIDFRGDRAILTLVLDLSERHRLQEILRETEDRYRTLFNNEQVGIFRWRLSEGRMLTANDRMARLLGYGGPEDLLREFAAGRHFIEPDTRERLLESAPNGRLQNFDTRFLRRDGSVVWLRISGRLDLDRDDLEGVASDLTEIRHTLDGLKSTEEHHRTLAEQLLGRTLLSAAEQQQLKEKIQGERDSYKKILGHPEEGIAVFDRDLGITLWNPPLERLTGISPTMALGQNIFRVLPFLQELPDESPLFEAGGVRRFFDLDQPQRLTPAGPEGFYAGRLTPLLDEKDEVEGGVLIIHDRTPLRQTENALTEQQDLLDGVLAAVEDGVAVLDRNLTFIKVNPALESWFARDEPLLGKNCHAVVHGTPDPCENCPARKILAGGKAARTVVLQGGLQGEEPVRELFCYPRRDPSTGEIVGVILRIVDITGKLRSEASLKQSRERLNLLANHLPLALGRLDREGTVTFWEGHLEELTGYAPEEFAPGGRPWSDAIVEEDREPARQAFLRGLGTDHTYVRQYRLKTKDSRIIWLQENGQIACDSRGRALHTDVVLLDITEQKLAEERCSRYEAQLAQQPRLDAIGSLAGSIAHDFNNILGVMLGYTEMALMSLSGDDVSRRRLQQVLKAGKRGKELVGQIIALSRPTLQERQPVHLSALVREVLPTLRATLPSRVELKVTLPENRDALLADPAQIHQVIISLGAHAIQAMRDQGGVLDLSVAPVNLDAAAVAQLAGLSPGPYLRLTVRDTGPGLDQEALEKVFDPLVSPEKTEGPGLGLAATQDIIKAHQGIITVRSKPGQGTEFHLYFPRLVAGKMPGYVEAAMENGRHSLLFVDDEEWLVDIWKEILESLGYRTTGTPSPLQALEMVKENPWKFDLVIADQTMPHMTGLELAEDLKTLRPELPVILITSFSESLSLERAAKVGIREYIMKPLSISELTNAIRRVLSKGSRD
jgi:PAS domain S-box-containing protein